MRRIDRVGKTLTKAIAVALSFSIMFGQTIGSYADELDTINEVITEAEADVAAAEQVAVDFEAIIIVDTAEVETELASYDVSASASYADSEEAISNATVANTTSDENEAIAAKETAENNLASAETALNESNEVLASAQENFNDVSANYATADNKYTETVAAMEDVSANTAAAEQALEEAKALIDAAEINKGKLEDMEDQYYGLMVYYYRKNNAAVYDVSGNLDIEASAAKISTDKQNTFAKKGDDSFFKFGRYLTKEMVEYMICNREDVSNNSEENQFTFGTTGGNISVSGQEAVVFLNDNNQDQTLTSGTKKDNRTNTYVSAGEGETYSWYRTGKDDGRGNYVVVNYVDKNGEAHTEYYNYVLKKAGEQGDLTSGPIYLALIEIGNNNNNTVNPVEDANNYSDYNKLVAAVEAYQALDTYTQRYNEAAARVTELQARYNSLSVSANATKAELVSLKAALEAANDALAAAEEKKADVEAKYEEAKKAVEGIDLSRFAVVPVTVVNDETTGEPVIVPVTETPSVVTVVPATVPAVAPVLAAPEGEEEEEIEQVAAEVTIDEDETALAAGPVVEETVEEVPAEVVAEITENIVGDEVPLASLSIVESMKNVWWLWLLILITVITMYIIYKRNAKKEETH